MKTARSISLIILSTFLAIITMAACCGPGASAPADQYTIRRSMGLTVVIHNRSSDREWGMPICGGVIVGPHAIVTARHCAIVGSVSDAEALSITLGEPLPEIAGRPMRYSVYDDWADGDESGTLMPAIIGSYDAKNDVAILRVDEEFSDWAHLALREADIGEPVYTISHQSLMMYSVVRGSIAHPRRIMDGITVLEIEIPIDGGASGGGVFDMTGHLLGVCSRVNEYRTFGFYAPAGIVAELLQKEAL